MQIEEYKAHLARLREEDSVLKIKNNSLEHAKVLVSNLFEHAQEEVLVYTSSLCKQFYSEDEVLKAAEGLKNRGITPRFLIQHNLQNDSELNSKIDQKQSMMDLKNIFGEEIKFRFLPEGKDKITIGDNNVPVHNFTVVDGKAFRYERYETEKGACVHPGGNYTKAVGCMNDKTTASLLKEVFEKHYNVQSE